jgi:hypothetical protein
MTHQPTNAELMSIYNVNENSGEQQTCERQTVLQSYKVK